MKLRSQMFGNTSSSRLAVVAFLFLVALLVGLVALPQGAFAADQGASRSLAAGSADLSASAEAQPGQAADVEEFQAKKSNPSYSGATSMPVSSKAVWTLKDCTIKVVSGANVVSITGKVVTAKKAGVAKIGVYNSKNVRIATRTVSVYSLSGKYLMQSCMLGKSNMCLDMDGASKANGAQMIVWGRNGGTNQQFTFLKQKDGSYVIKSVNSGKVLDVNGASKRWGQNVIQWQANRGNNQHWRLTVDAANRITFVNVNSNLVFDVDGGKADWGARMIQWGANGGLNQKWNLVKVNTLPTSNYKMSAYDNGKMSVTVGGKKFSTGNGVYETLTVTENGKSRVLAKNVLSYRFITNGTYIYYATTDSVENDICKNTTIYRMKVSTGEKKRIASGVDFIPLACNGRFFFYGHRWDPVHSSKLYVQDLSTDKTRSVGTNVAGDVYGFCGNRLITRTDSSGGGAAKLLSFTEDGYDKLVIGKNLASAPVIDRNSVKYAEMRIGSTACRVCQCSNKGENSRVVLNWTTDYSKVNEVMR